MIVSASYIAAALAMYAAALYLYYRMKLLLTASSMLVGFLLLIHGPAYLIYMLGRGSQSLIYGRVELLPNFDSIVVSLNFSIAALYLCVILGIELVNFLLPKASRAIWPAIRQWKSSPGNWSHDPGSLWPLLAVVVALVIFMAGVSIVEKHVGVLVGYLAVPGDEFAKIAYRQQYGGSQIYLYRLMLNSIAPMFIVWGGLAAWGRRSVLLAVATALLLALTVLGKLETLNKGPLALFMIQLFLAGYLCFSNRIGFRALGAGALLAVAVFYPIVRVAVPGVGVGDAISFLYYRIFDISNEALLEFFGAIPAKIAHMWGSNIRLFASLMGIPYNPAYDAVSQAWRGTGSSTTTAMFIADAWADFSYSGVVLYSLIAGAICRCIDLYSLSKGRTVSAIAVMAASFIGVYNLLISALPTAILSGGLVTAPVLAVIVMRLQKVNFDRWWQRRPLASRN